MTHSYMTRFFNMWYDSRHASFIWDMTHAYGTWLIQIWRDPVYVIWLTTRPIHMGHDPFIWDMTYSYITWPIHIWQDPLICDMTHDKTHSYGTWPIHMGHDPFIWDMRNACDMNEPCISLQFSHGSISFIFEYPRFFFVFDNGIQTWQLKH